MEQIQDQVTDLLEMIDNLIDWKNIPEQVRKKKYSIYSKRIAAISRNVENLDSFVENLLKDIAGDQLFVTREKANKLLEKLKNIRVNENEILEYIKKYPYLSAVLLGSRVYGKNGGEQ